MEMNKSLSLISVMGLDKQTSMLVWMCHCHACGYYVIESSVEILLEVAYIEGGCQILIWCLFFGVQKQVSFLVNYGK